MVTLLPIRPLELQARRAKALFVGLLATACGVLATPLLAHELDHPHLGDAVSNPQNSAASNQRHNHAPADAHRLDDEVRVLLQAFRRTGEDALLVQAHERVLAVLRAGTASPKTLVSAAFVQQSRHQFAYAERLLEQALRRAPRNNEAWLLLASIRLVRGDNEGAAQACGQLIEMPAAITITCFARVALARGDADQVYPRMRALLPLAESTLSPAHYAWMLSVTGDLAMASDAPVDAARHYRESLLGTEATQVRAAYVDALIAIEDLPSAQHALAHRSHSLALQVRALIVAGQLKPAQALSKNIDQTHAQFCDWIQAGDWEHAREMARFYLDVKPQPALALALAAINLQHQREPEDHRLVARSEALSAVQHAGRSDLTQASLNACLQPG